MIKFIFDLDGTVTNTETLPLITKNFGIEEDMEKLTKETVAGNIPFVESFIKRIHMMKDLPVDKVAGLLETTPLYPKIAQFINEHKDNCIIATGNLDCWVEKLCSKIGCKVYASHAIVEDNKVVKIQSILRKEKVIKSYQALGDTVIMIGEGNNDLEAMRQANISIASGLTHSPANSVLGIADYLVYEEDSLCRQINQLL